MIDKTQTGRRSELADAALFVLPALIPLVVFWIFPTLFSLVISFTDWDYVSPHFRIVGLSNYLRVLESDSFRQALFNTAVFSVGTVLPTIVLGLFLALLMLRALRGSRVFQLLLFSPWVTPAVAVSIVWVWIFDDKTGLANTVLELIGLPGSPWINSSKTAMLAVIIVTVWKGIGYTMIFYMTALEKVPQSLYEAADLAGVGSLQKLLHVTLPSISPTTFFLIIINTITALHAYDQISILTQGGPSGSTRTLLYYYYQLGFEQFRTGDAAAVSVILTIIIVALSVAQTWLSKRHVHY